MAKTPVSEKVRGGKTIVTFLVGVFLFVPARLWAAESFQTIIAVLEHRKEESSKNIILLEKHLASKPEILQIMREKYEEAQTTLNSRIRGLMSCIHLHRREGTERCDISKLTPGIRAVDRFNSEAKSILRQENVVLGTKMSLGEAFLKGTPIIGIFGIAVDLFDSFWDLFSCSSCKTAEELNAEFKRLLLDDWQHILIVRGITGCNWSASSSTAQSKASFAALLFNVADDVETMAALSAQRNLINPFYLPGLVLE